MWRLKGRVRLVPKTYLMLTHYYAVSSKAEHCAFVSIASDKTDKED